MASQIVSKRITNLRRIYKEEMATGECGNPTWDSWAIVKQFFDRPDLWSNDALILHKIDTVESLKQALIEYVNQGVIEGIKLENVDWQETWQCVNQWHDMFVWCVTK